MPQQFYAKKSEAAADTAIQTAHDHASDGWKIEARKAIDRVALKLATFTTDDVWKVLTDREIGETHEPRVLGALMREAARDGVCEATMQFRKSERVACHTRPLRVWRSLIPGARIFD